MVLGLPTSDQTKMKKKRRTLKNRGYAKTTRKRKEAEIKDLERVEKELKVLRIVFNYFVISLLLERVTRTEEGEEREGKVGINAALMSKLSFAFLTVSSIVFFFNSHVPSWFDRDTSISW